MMAVKTGTQSWSTAQQQVDHEKDSTRTVAADKQQELFGDQAVGDVLNKIVDPNWVDPSKAVRKVGDGALDKDAFMKLLLTQMKHQDPTTPMQSHEMAAQLAQFTSLEKLTNISEGIDGLTKAQQPSKNFEALNLIGKAVAGDSARIDRLNEGDTHPISFNSIGDIAKAEVKIKNQYGEVVRTLDASNLKAGKNEVVWNGKGEDGRDVVKGTYTVEIMAKNSAGKKMHVDTKFQGVISGVNFTAQGPVLMIGKNTVALKDIKEIIDPNLLQQDMIRLQAQQMMQGQQGAGAQPKQTQVKPAENAKQGPQSSNMESVGLARNMVNQLNKQGVKAGI